MSIDWVRVVCVAVVLSACPAAADEVVPPKPDVAAPAPPVGPARIIDPSVCIDPVEADCAILIDNDKAEKRSRIDALLVRAKALVAANQPARALADYDVALKLDPSMSDVLNTRGELRWTTGDRPRALADFTSVLKIRPDHATARENRKSLSKEIERIGAEMAVGKKSAPETPAPLK